ncbi:hypothetical protein [Desulfoferula mesophila]|uniref:Lipoprotein n=1 Tax=Desulfoferula mesophila TaxID=3058419 RepID=A0AAU9EJE4_9BACT|nr:hypothetical protein FAK_04550 [Desulfoferula mesophilus]
MLKHASVFGLLMVLMLAALPAWAGDSVTGYWDGSWTCTSGTCDKAHGGFMSASLQQDDNHNVTGDFAMHDTVKGILRCKVKKAVVASDYEFAGTIMCGSYSVGLAGKFNGDHFEGQYDGGSLGMGTFVMNR